MSDIEGWISLHRKLLDSAVFQNADLLKVWIWCLLKATHKDYETMVGMQVVELEPGQFITGRFKGSEELKMNPSTFYKYLKNLEKLSMITLNSDNKKTLVTIGKWDIYQSENGRVYQQRNNSVTTREQQRNTNNNIITKEHNNSEQIQSAFERIWKEYPKKIGKNRISLTTKKRLFKVGEDNLIKAIENYKKELDINKTDVAYIKHGSTFFNGDYEDYLEENYKQINGTNDQKDNRAAILAKMMEEQELE